MVEIWSTTSKGRNMLLWCDELRLNGAVAGTGKKRKAPDGATMYCSAKKTQQMKFSNMKRI